MAGSVARPGGSLLEEPTPAVRDVALVPAQQADGLASVIERLAANPSVDVVKLEKIIELQERILRHNAESAFNVAFSRMQPNIPTIIERASTDKTSYAPLEDIIEQVRPILAQHGFSLGFKTEWPEKGSVRVIGILTHDDGHSRTSEFLSAADQTGSKNAIQALASTVSYGKRYTAKDLLCIVTKREDDDAQTSEPPRRTSKPTPAGYDQWLEKLQDASMEGQAAFAKMWGDPSTASHRKYLMDTAPKMLASIKTAAAKAGK